MSSFSPEYDHFDHLFKISIIGDPGVGKSCMLLRFCDDTYTESYISTIGVDFKIGTREIDDRTVKLQIWDTPGFVDPFNHGRHRVFHAFIVAFDLTDTESFEHITGWLQALERYAHPNATKLVVGCKADLSERRTILFKDAKAFCDEKRVSYIEVSSKTATNVEEAFTTLARQLIKKEKDHEPMSVRVARENEAKKIKLMSEIQDRIKELRDEDPDHKKAVKIAKIYELNALREELSRTTGQNFPGVVHTFRTTHPILDKGVFSHRTRDLLNKYDSEGPA